jgi:hypothetical protein
MNPEPRMFWFVVRIVQMTTLLPASFFTLYLLFMVMAGVGGPHVSFESGVFTICSALGMVCIWGALFCRSALYERQPFLAVALLAGLLAGSGLAIYILANDSGHGRMIWAIVQHPKRLFPAILTIVMPLSLAVAHIVCICRALWLAGVPDEREAV